MPFQPGTSGNPSGRRKKTPEDKALEQLAREHSPAALEVLISIAKNAKFGPSARVSAATAIIDRGYGRPVQPVENDVSLVNYGISDREATADEWAAESGATH